MYTLKKGFLLLPLGFWALIATIGMLWGMIYEMSTHQPNPVEYRDERFEGY
jgi:hypothetical protein